MGKSAEVRLYQKTMIWRLLWESELWFVCPKKKLRLCAYGEENCGLSVQKDHFDPKPMGKRTGILVLPK